MARDEPYPQPPHLSDTPRYAGIPSFMRLPVFADASGLDIALAGVPWDGGTTNCPGARHGPREIRNSSSMMRRVNPANGIEPYALCRVGDVGDAPVNPVNLMDTLAKVTTFFTALVATGAVPLVAGGDHLISLPVLRAVARHGPVGLVHFDAHSDTVDRYFTDERYTHGTPFRRAVEEGLIAPERVVQIGIRGSLYGLDEFDFARDAGFRLITMDEFDELGVAATLEAIREVVGSGPVYVSFDVDGLDPVFAPGTGTPEIGGLTTREAQRLIRGLRGLDLVGGDVVEVAPPLDPSGNTALVGATLMFELLCILADAIAGRSKAGS